MSLQKLGKHGGREGHCSGVLLPSGKAHEVWGFTATHCQVKIKDGCRGGREQFQWTAIKEQEYKDGARHALVSTLWISAGSQLRTANPISANQPRPGRDFNFRTWWLLSSSLLPAGAVFSRFRSRLEQSDSCEYPPALLRSGRWASLASTTCTTGMPGKEILRRLNSA